MVNRLTPAQEMKMLRKSLEEIDEKSIAEALGMVGRFGKCSRGPVEPAAIFRDHIQ
jgi:DNA-binding phage protein